MSCKIHKVRYYNPKPVAIHCVSFNKSKKLLALSRNDATIEIWDMKFAPFLIKVIPGAEKSSVEALAWVHDRLLSTGLSGALTEWDLDKLSIKRNLLVTGYAAWCLDINVENTLAAIGTEQGYLNLYSVENNDIIYKKLFDKQEGRILCCKFNNTGSSLATGSIDTIRVWNVESGHATCRISVRRRGKETIVWCLAMLSDNVVVSGDSYGRLTFWDGQLGEQIESYKTHKRDIMAIAVSDCETSLYCSGVDPIIVNFIKVVTSNGKQTLACWVKNIQRNIHEHDVTALVINDNKLISLGSDGYLTQSSYPPKWLMRLPPMIPGPRSFISSQKKFLLLRYSNHLELWKLGSYATNKSGSAKVTNISLQHINNKEDKELEEDTQIVVNDDTQTRKQSLTVTEVPVKLVSIQSKKNKKIQCCDLSPSGEMLVYSTDSDMRILKLDCDDEQNVSVVKVMVNGVTRCDCVAFSWDSRTLAAHWAGLVHVLHADPEAGASVTHTIALEKYLKSTSIVHLVLSKLTPSKTEYLAVAGTEGDIAVWSRQGKKFEFHARLPTYCCVASAMMVDARRETLIVTYVNQKIIEYDLVHKVVRQWTDVSMPRQWAGRPAAVTTIGVHPRRDALLFSDESALWVLDRSGQENSEQASANKKRKVEEESCSLKIIPMKYLAGFHWLKEDEAVAVEILPENIVSQLPPVLATRRHNRE